MQLIQNKIKNFFTLPKPDRPVPTGFFKSLWLFLQYFIAEQFALAIGILSLKYKIAPLGIIIFLAIGWALIRQLHHYQNLFNGQHIKWPKPRQLVYALLAGYGITILYNMIVAFGLHFNIANKVSENQQNLNSYYSNPITIFILIVFGVIIAPIIEEFGFRYLIIKPNKKPYNQIRIITAIITFAFAHVGQQLSDVFNHQTSLGAWFYYFGQYAVIGLLLAFIYQKYRNYKFNIMVHMSWNAIALLVGLLTLAHK